MFFSKLPAPFAPTSSVSPKKKQAKSVASVSALEVVQSCYRFLASDVNFFKNTWQWSDFVAIFCTGDEYKQNGAFQLVCNHILALLTNMTSTQLNSLNRNIPLSDALDFETHFQAETTANQNRPPGATEGDDKINWILRNDILTNVEGVTLPIFDSGNCSFFEKAVANSKTIAMVESTRVNLRSLAVGVAAGKAICLSGPVGSGKTSLVEYLAAKTGRIPPKFTDIECASNSASTKENQNQNGVDRAKPAPAKKTKRRRNDSQQPDDDAMNFDLPQSSPNGFLRIQIGDQTDSKTLLGQYRCTDVPGEFVWQPGVLTQSVMHGYWLLLEDLDACTQDVCTVLTNLLENNYLSVPGFRDSLQISAGFQLFITLR